ncbi:hypothetical protein TPA0910_02460 [Streptomyces hygroscopicus subsp. sporocinereus]|uniref:Uncharacterized protein n=1 Tax=Streptomyces hygroscopicus TaxID=1912 RepID=A0ABQ3TRE0_STRHY|nr:hypothetical protein TPA0910_02460 [Streptomyces hygroscopicus]
MSGGEATGPVPGRGKDRAGRGIPVRPLIFAALMSFGAVRPLSGGGSAPRCWAGDSVSTTGGGPGPHSTAVRASSTGRPPFGAGRGTGGEPGPRPARSTPDDRKGRFSDSLEDGSEESLRRALRTALGRFHGQP